jgi:hypothetical protein
MNNIEIYHICVRVRQRKCPENCLSIQGYGERVRKNNRRHLTDESTM